MKEKGKSGFWDNFVLCIIFLALIHTFFEDWSSFQFWSWDVRKILIIIGFSFDLFFSIEFVIRFFASLSKGQGKEYFLHERGWVDLIASFPLLIFSSAPELYSLYLGQAIWGGAGVLTMLKIVKTVRIARILRLLRILKFIKKIRFIYSPMAQRHVNKITTIIVSTFILSLTLFSYILDQHGTYSLEDEYFNSYQKLAEESDLIIKSDGIAALTLLDYPQNRGLLILRYQDEVLYSKYDAPYYSHNFGPSDYGYTVVDDTEVFYSLQYISVDQAKTSLIIYLSLLTMILVFILLYSIHLSYTVTDPLNIMVRGMSDSSYHLEVLISKRHKNDEIYRLAKLYNEEFLPLKARSEKSSLQLDPSDVLTLFETKVPKK